MKVQLWAVARAPLLERWMGLWLERLMAVESLLIVV